LSLISKFKIIKEGVYVEDSAFGYRVDKVVFSPSDQELAVAVVRINIATSEQHRIVETLSFKKAAEPKVAVVKATVSDVADGVDRIPAPDTEAEPVVTQQRTMRRRGGSRSSGDE
jgi:hypothetical protein